MANAVDEDDLPEEVRGTLQALGDQINVLDNLFAQCTANGNVSKEELFKTMSPIERGTMQVLFADYLTTLHYMQLRLAGEKAESHYNLTAEETAKANDSSTFSQIPGSIPRRRHANDMAVDDETPLLDRKGAVGKELIRVQHHYQKLIAVEALSKGRSTKVEKDTAKRFVNHEIGSQAKEDGTFFFFFSATVHESNKARNKDARKRRKKA